MLQTAMISKAGGRRNNEDYCCFVEADGIGCYVLADGLGGHQKGELASRTIGEALLGFFKASPGLNSQMLINYIEKTSQVYLSVQQADAANKNMKATLVVLLTDGSNALWGHVGDSRLYYFQQSVIKSQTKDHSVPQKLADSGIIKPEEIRFHEDRNRLTAAFDGGNNLKFEVSAELQTVVNGDAFLLCSDGFWEYITEIEMELCLQKTKGAVPWLNQMERLLLKRAEAGHDNYSAVAVRLG